MSLMTIYCMKRAMNELSDFIKIESIDASFNKSILSEIKRFNIVLMEVINMFYTIIYRLCLIVCIGEIFESIFQVLKNEAMTLKYVIKYAPT